MNYAIVLAAGRGTRMQSRHNKVMHNLLGKPIIGHVMDHLKQVDLDELVVVTGFDQEAVRDYLKDEVSYAHQKKQIGTGDAVWQVDQLKGKKGSTLLLFGDNALIQAESMQAIFDAHADCDLTIATAVLEDPSNHSRVIRDSQGNISKIVDNRDLSELEKMSKEVNLGVYCFNNELLFKYLPLISESESREELNIIDLVKIMKENGHKIKAYRVNDAQEFMGINDRHQLAQAHAWLQTKVNDYHLSQGVSILDSSRTIISPDVIIEPDVLIEANVEILGKTVIREGVHIKSNSRIVDSEISSHSLVDQSIIVDSFVGKNNKIGPFAHLRKKSQTGDDVRIGNFVELKNTHLGHKSSAAHLSYLGDAVIGNKVNIGAGVITANYDGEEKHKTRIDDHVFVGSNVSLIAPIHLEEEAIVAAGSTLTDNVEKKTLAIAREKQKNIESYKKRGK